MEQFLDLSQKAVLKVKLSDGEYMVNVPTLAQVMSYQKRIKQDSDHVQCMVDFADELGFPKEAGLNLEFRQFEKLMSSLMELSEKK